MPQDHRLLQIAQLPTENGQEMIQMNARGPEKRMGYLVPTHLQYHSLDESSSLFRSDLLV